MVFGEKHESVSADTDMSVEHDLIFVEEFDALSIEVAMGIAPAPLQAPKPQKYPAKLHARKVAKELGLREGLIYLPGLPELAYEDSDMGPAFRQRRYFYYLGGVDFADCAVTYDLANDYLVLWVPYIDPRQVLWYGTSPGLDECKAAVDVDDVRYVKDLDSFLRQQLGVGGGKAARVCAGCDIVGASVGSGFCCRRAEPLVTVATTITASKTPPVPPLLLLLHADQAPSWLRKAALTGQGAVRVNTRLLQPAMDAARVIKTPYEIEQIRHANAISSEAHRAVLKGLRRFRNEREIEAAFLDHCLAVHGARHQAYAVIAGSGPNASVLHYGANDESLAGRQLVCLDAGAEWHLYASDVTRSFPISGTFTPQAAAIYAAVDRMQTEVFARFRPGVAFRDLHLHAAFVAAQELLRLGILHGAASPAQIVSAGTISAFFPHGLGHHVGLEVHDVLSTDLMATAATQANFAAAAAAATAEPMQNGVGGGNNRQRRGKRLLVTPQMYTTMMRDADNEAIARISGSRTAAAMAAVPKDKRRLLEPGMIITVEPGIYFCRPYIEAFFLANPAHARFINKDVLEKYYDVGGVRIEDCLLVTMDGYENLTTAPRGEEALRIINGMNQ